ncbi:transposable element Tcb2 transposase [Trichonephila clavipes]|nr:transposable element Tcb2 transposase [Trichonephila clavipes]
MSARDDRHQFRMAVNDSTTSSRQLTARWSTATSVLILASSISRRLLHRGLRAKVPLYRIPLTANHRWLRLQWAHEHRACATPEVVPFLQGILGAIFQQNNAHLHVTKTVRDFSSAKHMQLLPRPADSHSDMSPIQCVLVGVPLLIRVLQFQKTNFCCACKQYGIIFHKQTFKICLTPCHVV